MCSTVDLSLQGLMLQQLPCKYLQKLPPLPSNVAATVDLEATMNNCLLAESENFRAVTLPVSSSSDILSPNSSSASGAGGKSKLVVLPHCELLLMEKSRQLMTTLKCGGPIRAVSFVNYTSNTGASASDYQVDVWTVKEGREGAGGPGKLVCEVMVRLEIAPRGNPVSNLSFFIDQGCNAPNAFLLCRYEALIIPTASHIKSYSGSCVSLDLNRDAKVIRRFSDNNSNNADNNNNYTGAPYGGACAISDNGLFAFQVDLSTISVCTVTNSTMPTWVPSREEPVLGLAFVPSAAAATPSSGNTKAALLLATSVTGVFEWHLSGNTEPRLLRKYVFGNSQLVNALVSGTTIAVFNNQKQMAVWDYTTCSPGQHEDSPVGSVIIHPLAKQVPSSSRMVFFCRQGGCILHFIAQDGVMSFQWSTPVGGPNEELSSAAAHPGQFVLPSPDHHPHKAAAGPTTTITSSSSSNNNNTSNSNTANSGDSSISKSLQSTMLTNLLNASKQRSEDAAKNKKNATQPTYFAGGGPVVMKSISNSALPAADVGPLATILAQSKAVLSDTLQPIQNKLSNITEIENLTRKTLEDGSKRLISLSLEAQMAELQEYLKTLRRAGGAAPVNVAPAGSMAALLGARGSNPAANAAASVQRENDRAFTSYFLSLLQQTTREIITGIDKGAESVCVRELPRIAEMGTKSVMRQTQRDYIQKRFDELTNSAAAGMVDHVKKALGQLREELRQDADRAAASMEALRRENEDLKHIIRTLTLPGVLDELENMRFEIQQLRGAIQKLQERGVAGGNSRAAAGSGGNPSRSLLDTSLDLIRNGLVASGLHHLVVSSDPIVAVQCLLQLSPQELTAVWESKEVAVELWMQLVALLAKGGSAIVSKEGGNLRATVVGLPGDAGEVLNKLMELIEDILTEQGDALESARTSMSISVKTALRTMEELVRCFADAVSLVAGGSDSPSLELKENVKSLKVLIR